VLLDLHSSCAKKLLQLVLTNPHFKLLIQHQLQIDNVQILNRYFVQVFITFLIMQLVHQIKNAVLSLFAAASALDIPLRTHCQMLIVNVVHFCRTVRLVNLR